MGISRVFIANRGEIAVRIMRTCKALGMQTVLGVSDADRDSLPARLADRTVCIGPASASQSYLNIGAIIVSAAGTGCDAVHPGYGFLAESPELATACAENHLMFVGPRPDHIRMMGNKLEALKIARRAGVPTLAGSEQVRTAQAAAASGAAVGFPVLLKAAAGGGGRGMKVVRNGAEMDAMFASASGEARAAFGDDSLYVEKYVANARHVEVQVLADRHGNVVHLGERDCSLQRRHQKIVEESPAPRLAPALRSRLHEAAVSLAKAVAYENAGTVEFIFDEDAGRFYFLEMNTRIQVEHPVTEMITGIDIVREQFRIAAGEPLSFAQDEVAFEGHSIECRITAEIPEQGFRPSPGTITAWDVPSGPGLRVDTHCFPGYSVPMHYDSLLAKVVVHGADRPGAVNKMRDALRAARVSGVGTTVGFLRGVLDDARFQSGAVNTHLLEELIRERQGA